MEYCSTFYAYPHGRSASESPYAKGSGQSEFQLTYEYERHDPIARLSPLHTAQVPLMLFTDGSGQRVGSYILEQGGLMTAPLASILS